LRNVTIRDEAKLNPNPNDSNYCSNLAPTTISGQVRVPDNAVPSPPAIDLANTSYWPDATMAVLESNARYVWEFYQARKAPDGINWRATNLYKTDITLDGWSAYKCHHGTRASSSSVISGIVRAGELTNGIKHAIAVAVTGPQLNKNAPGGKSFVWPASSSDDPSNYASLGNVFMGSLLAIPSSVNLDALPFQTVAGKNVARALQLHGAYVVDITDPGGTKMIMIVEYNARAELPFQGGRSSPSPLVQDLRLAARYLNVISNNGPNSIGGGGTPLAPLAPPFAQMRSSGDLLASYPRHTPDASIPLAASVVVLLPLNHLLQTRRSRNTEQYPRY
jgi:hypothetical protein